MVGKPTLRINAIKLSNEAKASDFKKYIVLSQSLLKWNEIKITMILLLLGNANPFSSQSLKDLEALSSNEFEVPKKSFVLCAFGF